MRAIPPRAISLQFAIKVIMGVLTVIVQSQVWPLEGFGSIGSQEQHNRGKFNLSLPLVFKIPGSLPAPLCVLRRLPFCPELIRVRDVLVLLHMSRDLYATMGAAISMLFTCHGTYLQRHRLYLDAHHSIFSLLTILFLVLGESQLEHVLIQILVLLPSVQLCCQ